MSQKILIIAYEFYPYNTGGSHRPFRMAKFLKEKGYFPIVLTRDIDKNHRNYDYSLAKEASKSKIDVICVPVKSKGVLSSIAEKYYFNILDDTFHRWKKRIKPSLKKIIDSQEIQVVIVTVPPFSISNIVVYLKSISSKLPVFLDMRDAWSQWNLAPYSSILHYWMTVRKEKKILKKADQILVTSKITLEDLKVLHPEISKKKFIYVPNSIDSVIEPVNDYISVKPKDTINIGYVGSFYFDPNREKLLTKKWFLKKPYQWFQYVPNVEKWLYRSPLYIFKTIHTLHLKYPEYRKAIKIHIVGEYQNWLTKMIESFELSDSVELYGKLDKRSVSEMQQKMDYLLITSSKRVGKKDYSIAGKTFEYLGFQKPIIGFLTESAQKDILLNSGVLISFDPDDISRSVEQLKKLCDEGIMLFPNKKMLYKQTTENRMRPLLNIIEDIN